MHDTHEAAGSIPAGRTVFSPQVICEDKEFLVINKPAGLLVHGDKPNLVDWLLKNYPEVKTVGDDPENRPGIVHRLDKDTSGVMIICLTQRAFDYFKGLFQKRGIKKTYLALVYGELKNQEGVIEKPLGIKSGSLRRTAYLQNAKMIKRAVTRYRVKKILEKAGRRYSLIEAEPETGRTHQIRAHLAAIGHPVVGDGLYGPKKQSLKAPRQFLHAVSLELSLPDGQRLKVEADLPEELTSIIEGFNKIPAGTNI